MLKISAFGSTGSVYGFCMILRVNDSIFFFNLNNFNCWCL